MTRELAVQQWHRQLLPRTDSMDVEGAVRLAGGLYSTAPTSYLSCAARIPGFRRIDLDRALYVDRSLVRMAALRGSGFLIPLDMVNDVVSARDREPWYRKAVDKQVGADTRRRWRRRILGMLEGRTLSASEIREELGIEGKKSEPVRFLLSHMSGEQEIAAAGTVAGWRSNRYGYALWSDWFPGHRPMEVDADSARVSVATWYLRGHGPGTPDHFSWWSGLKKATALQALEDAAQIREDGTYDIDDAGVPAAEPSGLRLLPVWDTALVAPAGRRRMVRSQYQPFVYDSSGNVTSTIVRDGSVIGVWDRSGTDEHLTIKAAAFEGVDEELEFEIGKEASLLARAVGAADATVEFVDRFVDLTDASRNRFLSPLSGP
jgi:hypothetical protein